ncbi:MAG: cysteine peptidase family C39 domain-containing protein [Planctomycetota bacterium]
MPESLYYLVTALLSAAAFVAGLAIGRSGRRRALIAYGVLLLLLLFKGVLNLRPDWEFALFPWSGYIYFQSYLGFPLGLACLGLALGLLPRGRNRRAVAVLAAVFFAVSLWTERWILVVPDGSSTQGADAEHHCFQTTSYSCGPAACVSLLSCWGLPATEGEMMTLCRTPPYGGTSLFRICRGLRLKLLGLPFRVGIVDGEPALLRALGVPAIVSVRKVHVVTVRFDGDRVVVHDPAWNRVERLAFEDYRARYGGYAVVVQPEGE